MIKILVAEDEAPILRSICKMIEAQDSEFVVTCRAKNGKEALTLLKNEKPDVMFVDIQMPVMDGLTLLRKMKEEKLKALVVIVSGYQEFDYAREALRLGAMDYLLKPLKKEELHKVMEKVKSAIIKQRVSEESLVQPQSGRTEIYYKFAMCYFGSFHIDESVSTLSDWQKTRQKEFEQYLSSHLSCEDYWIIQGKALQEQMVLLKQNGEGFQTESLLRGFLKESSKGEGVITIVLCDQPVGMKDLCQIQTELKKCCKLQMKIDQDSFLIYDPQQQMSYPTQPVMKKSLSELCFPEQIEGFMTELLKVQEGNRLKILNALKILFFSCSEKMHCNYSYTELEESINSVVQNAYSIDYLFQELKKLIIDAFYEEQNTRENKEKKAYEIKAFLDRHYKEHISNQTLSERFGFVPAYIRTIFQQQFDKSPMAYLQALRIEKSKDWLLSRQDLSLKEIAEASGFADQLYFSRVFRKSEAMTPSEYRQKARMKLLEQKIIEQKKGVL